MGTVNDNVRHIHFICNIHIFFNYSDYCLLFIWLLEIPMGTLIGRIVFENLSTDESANVDITDFD